MERPPAEGCRFSSPPGVEKPSAIVNKTQPALHRYVRWRFVRIQPGKAFGPSTRRTSVVFDDGGAFFLGVAPGCLGCSPCDNCDSSDFTLSRRRWGYRCRRCRGCRRRKALIDIWGQPPLKRQGHCFYPSLSGLGSILCRSLFLFQTGAWFSTVLQQPHPGAFFHAAEAAPRAEFHAVESENATDFASMPLTPQRRPPLAESWLYR